ncbi:MAG: SGNH/GDSL hydrolase family protein [bacterium]
MNRVVLVGDSIRMHYEPFVREALGGAFEVISTEENGGTITNVLEHLNEWVIAHQPDVVHLNTGLHDLARSREGDGSPRTSPQMYRQMLERVFDIIREETDATIIWARTTPVNSAKHAAAKAFDRHETDVEAYNHIADEVAAQFKIKINDLYTFVMESGKDQLLGDDGVHFPMDACRLLGNQVARVIRESCTEPAHSKERT